MRHYHIVYRNARGDEILVKRSSLEGMLFTVITLSHGGNDIVWVKDKENNLLFEE